MSVLIATSDPVELIKTDHRLVETLYGDFKSQADMMEKQRIALQICKELSVHAGIEERFLYPLLAEKAPNGQELQQRAIEETREVQAFLAKIEMLEKDDPQLEVLMDEMMTNLRQHVLEEESEMLPLLKEHVDASQLELLATKLDRGKRTAPIHPPPEVVQSVQQGAM
eukprot:GILJ01006626.1.p1 GENE.GILJ01006626.1~~GILJ01006626.1.p1  ORF type:complete len:168 (-),score=40.07 GILJ01006626.1:107-610(-)